MCSIFGFNFDDKELLRNMGFITRHRGPDDSGYYVDDKISLGHNRLRIIDLSKNAKQPMCNEDSSIWLVYNGEVYNFMEIRRELNNHEFISSSDSEVIVHGYEEWGIDVLKKLRGMFAFAIYDSNKDIIFLARDRIGIKPLYYYFDGEKFIFSSEQKAILLHIQPKLNSIALDQFFTFQFTLNDTLFLGIKKLPPASYMIFDLKRKKMMIKEYWHLNIVPNEKPMNFYIDSLERLLKESVRLRLISDVPLGIYLSGGLDSSYIACLAKELKEDVKAYTVDFGHDSEVEYASEVTSHFDIAHEIIKVSMSNYELLPKVIWHLDKPAVNIASLPLYIMAKASKKYLTVALMGDGGDEVFGGYDKYRLMDIRERIKIFKNLKFFVKFLPLHKEIKKRMYSFISEDDYKAYLAYAGTFTDEEKLKLGIEPKNGYIKEYFKLNAPILQKLFYLDIKTLLPNDYLMKVDKMTMANAVEARVPYLDHKVVELSFKIPPQYKVKNLKTKIIFRKLIAKKLPKKIVKRKKHGFNVPTHKWIKEGLREVAVQLIDSSKILNKDFAKKIVYSLEKNKRYYTRQFWSIFTFLLWYKMYFEVGVKEAKFNIDYYIGG